MKVNLSETPTNLKKLGKLLRISKTDTYYEGEYSTGELIRISFLTDSILRIQVDPSLQFSEYPAANDPTHQATMTVKLPATSTKTFRKSELLATAENFRIRFGRYTLVLKKSPALIALYDEYKRRPVFQETEPLSFGEKLSRQTLLQNPNEFYFGGGTQNGKFSHKGEEIEIANTNIWTDGGVASPNPFFWSNSGFGAVRHTFAPGNYDFGKTAKNTTIIDHDDPAFDSFYLLGNDPAEILVNYYKLTGFPVLLPKFGFYEGHLNAYNRDYWVETTSDNPRAIKFEDDKYYQEFLPKKLGDRKGILESLNGDGDNYQFSARAVIDRYQKRDIPLGWFLPNDGYGAGYGQTDSLTGDLHNLEAFSNYANKRGVEMGLWTQSNLHPKDPENPQKGERDLDQEISKANLAVLKTDVAWVGDGYSFGLNGIEDAAKAFIAQTKGKSRPFIISLDGWAGTQRYAGIWSGDQVGGEWEYIRFHIPTYIGTSLSGQPNIGSDMDGIFGGGDVNVNVRDYQWKAFTPIQLNMDGWGTNPKNPFTFGRRATQVNRAYLKLKSQMLPYIYSIAHDSVIGKPMVRAMFLEFPHDKINYTKHVQYQYMWGPSLLIAPIYNGQVNGASDSVRNKVFLPDAHQLWIDYFTGKKYLGGASYDNLVFPHWHAPVFVKAGAILPLTKANNNPKEIDDSHRIFNFYPGNKNEFELFDDDGKSTDYLNNKVVSTIITSELKGSKFSINIGKTTGDYSGFVKDKTTTLNILVDHHPGQLTVDLGGQIILLTESMTELEFDQAEAGFYYNEQFSPSEFFTTFSDQATQQKAVTIKLPKIDVTAEDITLSMENTSYGRDNSLAKIIDSAMKQPRNFGVVLEKASPTSITLHWQQNYQAEQFEIMINDMLHTNIKGNEFTFEELDFQSVYKFKIRSKMGNKVSEWSEPIAGRTLENPMTAAIPVIDVSSTLPDQQEREIKYLVDQNVTTEWATDPDGAKADPENGKYLELTFEFEGINDLAGLTYIPWSVSGRGTFTKIALSYSTDGQSWTEYSEPITWEQDTTNKNTRIDDVKAKFVKLRVLASDGNMGSSREILFFKKKK